MDMKKVIKIEIFYVLNQQTPVRDVKGQRAPK